LRWRNLGSQDAGYRFQEWFYDFSQIPNRKAYVHDDRQICGSLTVAGTTYLIELKFTTGQASATDIGTFHKKVTTEADNTMGIMISISGYSSIARQEASAKELHEDGKLQSSRPSGQGARSRLRA
jgi:hypothetical protein